jgi:hypothetical protein
MVVRLHELRVHGGRVRRIRRKRRDILRRIRELKEFRHVPLPESVEREEEREPAHRFSRFIPSPRGFQNLLCLLLIQFPQALFLCFSLSDDNPSLLPLLFLGHDSSLLLVQLLSTLTLPRWVVEKDLSSLHTRCVNRARVHMFSREPVLNICWRERRVRGKLDPAELRVEVHSWTGIMISEIIPWLQPAFCKDRANQFFA